MHESILGTTFTGHLLQETTIDFAEAKGATTTTTTTTPATATTATAATAAAAVSVVKEEGGAEGGGDGDGSGTDAGLTSIPAVMPTVSGRAWVTQHCQVVIDPSDPFQEGYTVGDIWSS